MADVVDPANALIAASGHARTASTKGTDSALHPVNPDAPIKGGDLILLRSGNHGSPFITDLFNSDFITVAAAPGATPIIGKTTIVSSAKWLFQNLTFEGVASAATGATSATPAKGALVSVGVGDWQGQTSDIVFDGDTFRAAGSTNGWTDFDWVNKPYSYALRANAPCTNITGAHVITAMNGIAVTFDRSLVQGSTIESFSNDAINITAGNLTIKGNTIKNGRNTLADPLHADGIQGWSATSNGVAATNANVTIDGNLIVKTGDPKTTYLQGISIFDGKWTNLVVENNVVAVNTWDGITIYGTQNTKILNNTVVSSDPAGHPSWIQVHDGKDGIAASGAIVRNNISTVLDIAKGNTVFDHNIAAAEIITAPKGTRTVTTADTIGTANAVLPDVLKGFVTLDPKAGAFDLRLRTASVAVGYGTASGAPALDILGKTRTAPIDVGAYIH